jgi:hypothetical protein
MEIKILSPEEVKFKEKDVQNAFERDLSKLEEGLEFVGFGNCHRHGTY